MGFSNIVFGLCFFGSMGFFGWRFFGIWKNLHLAKGVEENRFDQIPLRIKNVLVKGLIQPKMMKDFIPGLMHALIFWGFLTVSIGTLETMLAGFYTPFNFSYILGDGFLYKTFLLTQDLANAWVLFAILVAVYRRVAKKSKRLDSLAKESKLDAMIVLTIIGALVTTALISLGARVYGGLLPSAPLFFSKIFANVFSLGMVESASSWIAFDHVVWWLHVLTLFGFMVFLPFSKHQHFIWAFPNIFFRNLKSRGRLRPLDLEDENAESFGVGKAEDFTWKQLLDGYTCVECGRCQEQCPAYNTGKPLDPRKIAHDLKYSLVDMIDNPKEENRKSLIGGFITEEELWGCTTCGACMEACPLEIEHIPAIVDMRRHLVLTEGKIPNELNQTFTNLENNYTPWSGVSHSTRADWAKDQNVTTYAENPDVEYCFWVGCAGSYDERYKKVSRAFSKILNNAGVSFSILGTEEKCNGDTARRLGNEYLAQMAIQENVETMQKYKIKKIVTGCPHCFNTIKNEYPDFGFDAEVLHHSEIITDLIKEGKLKLNQVPEELKEEKTTFHDSCYIGRHNDNYQSPREVLTEAGANLVEMPRSKEKGMCCGAGGGRMWLEEDTGTAINEDRAKEAADTYSKTVATACPFCMTMLSDGVKSVAPEKNIEVRDIAEIVADQI